MKALKTIFVSVAIAAVAPAIVAKDAATLKLSDIEIARYDDGKRMKISLDINPADVNPGRDREVIFTPVLRAEGSADSLELSPVYIAGRNRYYHHLRNNDLPQGTHVWSAADKGIIEYRTDIDFMPWMQNCTIDMRQSLSYCCDPMQPAPETPLARLDYTEPVYDPQFEYVALTGDESIERSAEGSAFIDFIVNRTEIREHYRGNRAELAKIISSIDFVKNDPDAIITGITIKGYASPEGSYSNNVRLAVGRTEALKVYVRDYYHFDPAIMSTDYEPEDWEGLRRRLLDLDIPHRDEILSIVDSDLEPDPKNSEIQRRYPKEYKFLLDSIYPALRHSDYTVKYKIRTYVDIEELKQVYATNPANLRPVDFQRIASTLTPGSAEYEAVYLKAAEVHPTDRQAAINAANIYMKYGKLDEAQNMLDNAGNSAEATYSRATLAAMAGDLQRARNLFDRAAADGMEKAAGQRDTIDAFVGRQTVQYLIKPTK